MSGMSVKEVMALVRQSVMDRLERKRREAAEKAARDSHVFMLQQEEAERMRLRAESLHTQFDMGAAIREGHIRIVASEGVAASDPAPLRPASPPPQPEPVPDQRVPEETPAPAGKAHGKKGKKKVKG